MLSYLHHRINPTKWSKGGVHLGRKVAGYFLASILFLSVNHLGYSMDMQAPLTANLEIEVKDQIVFANLTYTNISKQTLFVEKYKLALNEDLSANAFNIKTPEGKLLKYTGYMVKRKFSLDNFIALDPGLLIATKVNLNQFYDFPESSQKYHVTFSTFHPFNGLDQMYEVISNSVEFTYP